jgi:ATP-dependent Lhr-like helicase
MSLSRFHPRLQDYVKDKWRGGLTEIQEKAFDPIYSGKSCIIEAPTSGGKTEAVLFPLLTRIRPNKSTGFKILYIAPLKALLNDLSIRVRYYAEMCYLEAFKWHGDVSQADKVQQMLFPSDILLTTPESIEAILLRKANWKVAFKDLETIIIDEAHYFALGERGSHLCSLLERIESGIDRPVQRIAVTATIGNPDGLLNWLMGNRSGGISIRAKSNDKKERDFKIYHFQDEKSEFQNFLYRLLKDKKSIVFAMSRSSTEEIAAVINEKNVRSKTNLPVKVKTHHSSVSKRLREDAESAIKQNTETSLNAIISTSTLELGIDIGELDQVIQIGGLESSSSFLQRVGRTGRRPHRPQYFRGLCIQQEELLLLTGCVSLGLKHISEHILLPKKSFHILAHQIICLCLQEWGTTADLIWRILSKASCFSGIHRSEFDQLIKFMVQSEFLTYTGKNILITGNKTEEKFLGMNWKRLFAIFDTGLMYNVVNGKKIIGTLDSDFARGQNLPFIFVLGGQEWNTIKLDHERQQVLVQKNETGIAPKWKAFCNHDIPFEVAQETGQLLMNDLTVEFLDMQGQGMLKALRNEHHDLNWQSDKWILEGSETAIFCLWTFSGDKINRAISLLLSQETNREIKYDYMKVVLKIDDKIPLSADNMQELILSFKSKGRQELETQAENNLNVKWFSKFSECLPSSLAKKTLLEKSVDVPGLIRELNRVNIEPLA